MKNTILALTICGALLNPVFANGTELSKETLSQEPLTTTKDEQPKDKHNKNVHLRTGLMMSGAKGFLAGVLSYSPSLTNKQKGFIKVISTLTNMGIDYLTRFYQEDMWHPKSKGDRGVALLKSIAGVGSSFAIASFLNEWFKAQNYDATRSAVKLAKCAWANMLSNKTVIISGVIGIPATLNIAYQIVEEVHSHFKKPSVKASEKTSDKKQS